MTDDLTQAELLEALAGRVAQIERASTGSLRDQLEDLLGNPMQSRIGAVGMPTLEVGGGEAFRTLGNVAPYFGQANLLRDPTFETFRTATVGTTENSTTHWRTKYVLNSGTAPSTRTLARTFERDSDYNPFNSAILRLTLQSFASGDTTFYVYPALGFVADANVATLPYIVAACRVGDFGDLTNTLTNITSVSISLEVLNAGGGVIAESPVLDFKAQVGRRPEIQQIIATVSSLATTITWRLKIVVIASGAGGSLRINFGEPQLHYSYSPDAAPFAPQIARWPANRLRAGVSADFSSSDSYVAWDSTMHSIYIGDGSQARPVTPVGWMPYAFMLGFSPTATLIAHNLTANGGTFLIPVVLAAPMKLNSVSVWNTDTATARTWGWDLYADPENDATGHGAGAGTVDRVAQSSADESFTPGAASLRSITASSSPVLLPPGLYWLAVQNRHATNTFGLGSVATGTMGGTSAKSKTTTNPNGATLDASSGWTTQTNLYGVRLNGRVFDDTTSY